MGSIATQEKTCWVTLITKASYLPGAIILAYTLDKHGSQFPLVVQYTSTLGEDAITTLKEEAASRGRIKPQLVELLVPRTGQENVGSVADRFKDTFTKLRAFQVYEAGYTRACFLDADMAIFQNPDTLFDTKLPSRDWLGATNTCVCNLDLDPWAPPEWHKGNCVYSLLTNPDQIAPPIRTDSRSTYQDLNGGMFLFYPTEELWQRMLDFFNTSDRLKAYQFPDQEFLADFYRFKWQPMSWRFNALKTWRYWHPAMWSDDELVVLHYIVDKPWERRVSSEGVAGYLGRDGATHQWWWDIYMEWHKSAGKDSVVLRTMSKLVDTQPPFTEVTPMPQKPGKPEDVQPFP